jgi:hypothetical protein
METKVRLCEFTQTAAATTVSMTRTLLLAHSQWHRDGMPYMFADAITKDFQWLGQHGLVPRSP